MLLSIKRYKATQKLEDSRITTTGISYDVRLEQDLETRKEGLFDFAICASQASTPNNPVIHGSAGFSDKILHSMQFASYSK